MSLFKDLVVFAVLGAALGCAPDMDNQKTYKIQETQPRLFRESEAVSGLYDFDLRYPGERKIIEYTAERVCRAAGINGRFKYILGLMMAIRAAENGRAGREFGIIPTERYNRDTEVNTGVEKPREYWNTLEKQASWCAWTLVKRLKEWENMAPEERSKYRDFIDYLGDFYCPVGAANDPRGLNRNWERNVRVLMKKYRAE